MGAATRSGIWTTTRGRGRPDNWRLGATRQHAAPLENRRMARAMGILKYQAHSTRSRSPDVTVSRDIKIVGFRIFQAYQGGRGDGASLTTIMARGQGDIAKILKYTI